MDSEKFLRHLRRGTTRIVLLAATVGTVWAQSPADEQAAQGIAALDGFLQDVHSLTATFEQELWSADGTWLETAVGTLSLKRPNRFYLDYQTPIVQSLVTNGEELWIYDVELAQATVTPLDQDVSASPAMLLSGNQAARDSFDVIEDFVLDGADWVRLSPKRSGTDFRSVLIGFREGLPWHLEFVNGLDQTTRMEFSDVVVNTDLDDSLFEFQVPPGVDVFGDDG